MTAPDAGRVTLSAVNPDLNRPVMYLGEPATLNVQLVNGTSADIAVAAQSPAMLLFFLPEFFASPDVAAATVDLGAMPGWAALPVDTDGGIPIVYQGEGLTWRPGDALTFTVKATSSTTQSATGTVQVNPTGIAGVPLQVLAPLAIIAPPKPGNAKLAGVLAISLDHQGIVYVSNPNDPLSNALFLNIKNTSGAPLYTGSMPRTVTPEIDVSFTYGWSSGALAPVVDDDHPLGAAWNITAGILDDGGNAWGVANPDPKSAVTPSWTLSPSATNAEILGTGDSANVTFGFRDIVCFVPPGHTQMMLRFSGLQKDDTTAYDEDVFILDVLKDRAPETRGLLSLFSAAPVGHVTSPSDQFVVSLRWAMRQVAKIAIINSYAADAPATEKVYASPPPSLDYDDISIPLTGFERTTPVFFTVQAFDGAGAYLNAMQFTALVHADEFVDPTDGNAYPAVQIGKQQWMAANLARAANSYPSSGDAATYGRLYTAAAAGSPVAYADGWRLPQRSDWEALVAALGSPTQAYAALVSGGSTGFNAVMGGYRDDGGSYGDVGAAAYFWTSTPGSQGGTQYVNLSTRSKSVNVGFEFAWGYAASVRYVRDIS